MAVASRNSALAVVSLVFGLLAWVALPIIGSLVAIGTGHMARAEIRRAYGQIDGDLLATIGLILGWSQLLLVLVSVLFTVFLLAGVLTGSVLLVVIGLVAAAGLSLFALA
ncbi:MAG: DUF4190 domain-containing protein [Pseudomonadota bacterium]